METILSSLISHIMSFLKEIGKILLVLIITAIGAGIVLYGNSQWLEVITCGTSFQVSESNMEIYAFIFLLFSVIEIIGIGYLSYRFIFHNKKHCVDSFLKFILFFISIEFIGVIIYRLYMKVWIIQDLIGDGGWRWCFYFSKISNLGDMGIVVLWYLFHFLFSFVIIWWLFSMFKREKKLFLVLMITAIGAGITFVGNFMVVDTLSERNKEIFYDIWLSIWIGEIVIIFCLSIWLFFFRKKSIKTPQVEEKSEDMDL